MTTTLHCCHQGQDRDPPHEQMLIAVFLMTEGVPPHEQLLMCSVANGVAWSHELLSQASILGELHW